MGRGIQLGLRSAVLAGAIAVAAAVAGASSAGAATQSSCSPWGARTVASNLGILENLSFDGTGGDAALGVERERHSPAHALRDSVTGRARREGARRPAGSRPRPLLQH